MVWYDIWSNTRTSLITTPKPRKEAMKNLRQTKRDSILDIFSTPSIRLEIRLPTLSQSARYCRVGRRPSKRGSLDRWEDTGCENVKSCIEKRIKKGKACRWMGWRRSGPDTGMERTSGEDAAASNGLLNLLSSREPFYPLNPPREKQFLALAAGSLLYDVSPSDRPPQECSTKIEDE